MTLAQSWSALSTRERRLIPWAVGCVVVGILIGRGFPALNEWTSFQRSRRSVLIDSLAQLNAVVAWRQSPEGRAASVARASSSLAVVAIAPNRAAAEAKLMEMISDAADDADFDVTSMQIVPEPQNKRGSESSQSALQTQRVSLRASGSGDIDALTAFLSFADTSRTPVMIRALTVSPRPQVGSQVASPLLTLDIQVSALVHIPAASALVRVR